MQQVLMGLNPLEWSDFVSVYIDDVLVFSQTLEEHIEHLCLVMKRLREANLWNSKADRIGLYKQKLSYTIA